MRYNLCRPTLVCAAALVAGAAHGQEVSLSGSVDVVVRHDTGLAAGSATTVAPGGMRTSRLTLKASENLGGGLRAQVVLEGGLSVANGAGMANAPGVPPGGFSFGRTAALGLGSDQWGYVTFGRQYTPMQGISSSPHNDPFGGAWLGGVHTIYNKPVWASNAITYSYGYTSEAMLRAAPRKGLGVALLWAPGEAGSSGLSRAGEQLGAGISYGDGPWWLAYAWHRIRGSNAMLSATAPVSDTPVQTSQTLSGAYDFGWARFHAGYNLGRTDTGTMSRRNAHLGLTMPVGSVGTFRLLVGRASDRISSNRSFSTVQLAYQHDLSKRTALYVVGGQVSNASAASAALNGTPSAVVQGGTARAIALGIRHNF